MKHLALITGAVILALSALSAQQGMSKLDYYNNILAPQRGYKALPKAASVSDRKRSVMDVGNVWARISNAATLGYDRWGLCYEFPAKSGFTYRWTMAPLIGAKKRDGSTYVASGTRGAARYSEEEYQPLKGFDAGIDDERNNIGIAFSDKKESWPAKWPNTLPIDSLPANARYLRSKGYTYTQPKIGSQGFPGVVNGEVKGKREAYFVVTDNDLQEGNKPNPMDVRVDMWAMQWDDILNQNFIVYKMIVTNVGTDTLIDVYLGMHDDPDCPEQGGNEWMDDFAAFIPVGADVPGYDSKRDSLLWNFSYLWDGDDKVEGLIAKNVGWVGLKFLETPTDATSGRPRGITTFQVFAYDSAPQNELDEYAQLAAGLMTPINLTPHARDWTQSSNTYGPDITYVVASGPFVLPPGGQLNFAFATIHAANKSDLFNSAIFCQSLYNFKYEASEPPPEPQVNVGAGDRQVTLYWDNRSEKGIYYKADGTIDHIFDKATRKNAFQGYQVFKSTDRGVTWGDRITDVRGGFKYWKPLAQYDFADGIAGESTSELGRYFWLGDDTGVRHTFVDRNVSNGYEYWYAVCAYDGDDGTIPPLLNSIKSNRQNLGGNTVAVVPAAPPKDLTLGGAPSGAVLVQGRSTVQPQLTILEPEVITGKKYKLTINASDSTNKKFSLFNAANNTPVIAISATKTDTIKNWPLYTASKDDAPIFDGIRLLLRDQRPGINQVIQTMPQHTQRIRLSRWSYMTSDSVGLGLIDDYEVIFGNPAMNDTLWSWCGRFVNKRQIFKVPLYVRNITTGERVIPVIGDQYDSTFDIGKGDTLSICALPYDTVTTLRLSGWFTGLFAPDTTLNYLLMFDTTSSVVPGDKIKIITNHPLVSSDVYEIQTVKQTAATMKESGLDIQAVPNPYVVSSYYEVNKFGIQKEIQFHHLPPKCTIRIFNVAGDLIRTLIHDAAVDRNPSIASWDLQTYNGQEVAFGVYIFHVDAPGIGEYVGKLALIK